MGTYFGTSINESPTIVMDAGEKLENARGIALVIKDGMASKPAAGAHVIGISLIETDEVVEKGASVDIQVKDIGKWVAGGAIGACMRCRRQGSGGKNRRFYRRGGAQRRIGCRHMGKSTDYQVRL